MNCEDLNHYFSTRFEQIQFENIQDANLYIENISSAKVKYQENYYELSEILISDYIREVWISEFPPSEKFAKSFTRINESFIWSNVAKKENIKIKELQNKCKNLEEELEVEKLLKQFKNPFISSEFLSEKKNKSNFLEKEDRFILEMLIPGFNKEDIEISLDDFKITVKT